jgi:polysaccharide pyruvyl transferase WcaK-like protein
MSDPAAVRRIGVLGHVGNGNLGDEAIISVVIQNIKRRWPSAEIRCFTSNPEDTRERHGVTAFPIRRIEGIEGHATADNRGQSGFRETTWLSRLLERVRIGLKSVSLVHHCLKGFQRTWQVLRASLKEPGFLLQSHRNLRGIDLLIVAGSQQLIDYVAGGPWNHPYTLFKWVLLAKARKTRVAFMSVGAGPVQSALGRFFIRNCLLLADYRSCRDEVSGKCIEQLGVPGQNPVFPDLAYSLCVKEGVPGTHSSSTRPFIGINPLPFSDPRYWTGASANTYDTYIREIANFALWLIQRGYAVLFFPTQLRADPPAIEAVRIHMKRTSTPNFEKHVIDYPVHTFDELITAISMTDLTIATRYHGVVMSYLLNKPVLGIAYASKTNDLMAQMGQAEYALDILRCELKSLQERFVSLESRKAAIKREIAQRVSTHRKALDVQYDQVFKLLEKNLEQGWS